MGVRTVPVGRRYSAHSSIDLGPGTGDGRRCQTLDEWGTRCRRTEEVVVDDAGALGEWKSRSGVALGKTPVVEANTGGGPGQGVDPRDRVEPDCPLPLPPPSPVSR